MTDLSSLPGFLRYKERQISEKEPPWKQWLFRFSNNYGASVISGYGAYSDKDHPYELGVVLFLASEDRFCLVYPSHLCNGDVIGHLDAEDVGFILNKIKELP